MLQLKYSKHSFCQIILDFIDKSKLAQIQFLIRKYVILLQVHIMGLLKWIHKPTNLFEILVSTFTVITNIILITNFTSNYFYFSSLYTYEDVAMLEYCVFSITLPCKFFLLPTITINVISL